MARQSVTVPLIGQPFGEGGIVRSLRNRYGQRGQNSDAGKVSSTCDITDEVIFSGTRATARRWTNTGDAHLRGDPVLDHFLLKVVEDGFQFIAGAHVIRIVTFECTHIALELPQETTTPSHEEAQSNREERRDF